MASIELHPRQGGYGQDSCGEVKLSAQENSYISDVLQAHDQYLGLAGPEIKRMLTEVGFQLFLENGVVAGLVRVHSNSKTGRFTEESVIGGIQRAQKLVELHESEKDSESEFAIALTAEIERHKGAES